ncbi:hypothetical protein NDU88_000512 [Pleurodeles waltl]|uniref:Uncharacterized protein n=1 Tax=Pleurodeles waltl TaxID=8319 RepID=A0AAV7URH7_PLEWA|nr:hypothetical protein NDU88_000512 [Pleurodeles waltl]
MVDALSSCSTLAHRKYPGKGGGGWSGESDDPALLVEQPGHPDGAVARGRGQRQTTEQADWGVGRAGPLPAPDRHCLAGLGAQCGPTDPPKRGDTEPGALSAGAGAWAARWSVAATTGGDPGNPISPPSMEERRGTPREIRLGPQNGKTRTRLRLPSTGNDGDPRAGPPSPTHQTLTHPILRGEETCASASFQMGRVPDRTKIMTQTLACLTRIPEEAHQKISPAWPLRHLMILFKQTPWNCPELLLIL